MLKFLRFVSSDLKDSEKDFGSSFVRRLQDRIYDIKRSRLMNERYSDMIDYRKVWEKEAREEGLAEGRASGLADGIIQGKMESARNMLANGMSVEQAARYSGLPVEEVTALAENR